MQDSPLKYVCYTVTTRCNASCRFCYRVGVKVGDIAPNLFSQSLGVLRRFGCEYLTITGGEPLLHPHWEEFVRMVRLRGMKPILSTNGLLLDTLGGTGVINLDTLALPLESSEPRVNDDLRGPGHFASTVGLIDEYLRGDFPFTLKVNTIVSQRNRDHILEICRSHFNDERVTWKLFELSTRGHFNAASPEWCLQPAEFEEVLSQVRRADDLRCRLQWLRAREAEEYYLIVSPSADVYVAEPLGYERISNLMSLTLLEDISASRRLGSQAIQSHFETSDHAPA